MRGRLIRLFVDIGGRREIENYSNQLPKGLQEQLAAKWL